MFVLAIAGLFVFGVYGYEAIVEHKSVGSLIGWIIVLFCCSNLIGFILLICWKANLDNILWIAAIGGEGCLVALVVLMVFGITFGLFARTYSVLTGKKFEWEHDWKTMKK